ncbi:hypothetical protein E6C60_1043 [Paenibacillus algicola]|uniref:Peptidase C39-like domain-containing protein n=1 Tax=Paenibacillus algicola TaxID=2565926 RepID=A0A4P8XK35_9BACL|nr:C39 family peptidase [Paenibacillus algicola]QCT01761.1 hypothetical protein E6C60_1043 [Paenibacillus algicola]
MKSSKVLKLVISSLIISGTGFYHVNAQENVMDYHHEENMTINNPGNESTGAVKDDLTLTPETEEYWRKQAEAKDMEIMLNNHSEENATPINTGKETGAMKDDPTLTPETEEYWKKQAEAKDKEILMTMPLIQSQLNGSIGIQAVYTVGVPNYQQETSYWCGPAAVRQTLAFHKNKSNSTQSLPSQTTLASLAGTSTDGSTTTGLAKALNNYNGTFGSFVYVAADITTAGSASAAFDLFKSRVTSPIINETYAPIVLLETVYLDRYSGRGIRHYNTVSGWNNTAGQLRLVDPHNNNQYLGTFWDPMGSGSSNGVFRAVYNADLNGTNKAMVY